MSVLHVSFLIKMFTSSELVLKGSAAGRLEHQEERLKSSVKNPWHRNFFPRITWTVCLSES